MLEVTLSEWNWTESGTIYTQHIVHVHIQSSSLDTKTTSAS